MSVVATWLLIISFMASVIIGGMWLYIDSMKRELEEYRHPW
jgi:hypothetical protein